MSGSEARALLKKFDEQVFSSDMNEVVDKCQINEDFFEISTYPNRENEKDSTFNEFVNYGEYAGLRPEIQPLSNLITR